MILNWIANPGRRKYDDSRGRLQISIFAAFQLLIGFSEGVEHRRRRSWKFDWHSGWWLVVKISIWHNINYGTNMYVRSISANAPLQRSSFWCPTGFPDAFLIILCKEFGRTVKFNGIFILVVHKLAYQARGNLLNRCLCTVICLGIVSRRSSNSSIRPGVWHKFQI